MLSANRRLYSVVDQSYKPTKYSILFGAKYSYAQNFDKTLNLLLCVCALDCPNFRTLIR